MSSISNHGYHWRAFVWCPAAEHDRWLVAATEEIAMSLQRNKVKVVAEVLEEGKASIAVPISN